MEVEEEAKTKSKFKSKSVDEDGPKPESLEFSASQFPKDHHACMTKEELM